MGERFYWNWNNVISTPNRWMAYWLRRRGWVCFYLDQQARTCGDICWLRLYENSEQHDAPRCID